MTGSPMTDAEGWRISKKIPVASLVAGAVALVIQTAYFASLWTQMDGRVAYLERERAADNARQDKAVQDEIGRQVRLTSQDSQIAQLAAKIDGLAGDVKEMDAKLDSVIHVKRFDRK